MTLLRINILPLTFDNLYSILCMSLTIVAPWRWQRYAAESCRSIKSNCVINQ